MLKLDPGNQDIIDKINKERDAKKPKHKGMGPAYKSKSSGGTVRLKSGGPVETVTTTVKEEGKMKQTPDSEYLDKIVGRPTGQGYGAARKGPNVIGPETDVVVDEKYSQPQPFKVEKGG